MNINFYYNKSDARQLYKELTEGATLSGQMRDECSIIHPVVLVESDVVFNYNYCYIPKFSRYYSVTNVECVRTNVFRLSLECDVLMSHKRDIERLQVVASKSTDTKNGDEYIDDGSLVAENRIVSTSYEFGKCFNDNPNIILITTG